MTLRRKIGTRVGRSRGSVLVVANTNTTTPQDVDVILEFVLSKAGQAILILYTNKTAPTPPTAVQTLTSVQVVEVDQPTGTIGTGPLHVTHVTLQPMEVQVLRAKA